MTFAEFGGCGIGKSPLMLTSSQQALNLAVHWTLDEGVSARLITHARPQRIEQYESSAATVMACHGRPSSN